jgi:hypothetical protein
MRGKPWIIWMSMNAPKNARPNSIASFFVEILSNSDESDP